MHFQKQPEHDVGQMDESLIALMTSRKAQTQGIAKTAAVVGVERWPARGVRSGELEAQTRPARGPGRAGGGFVRPQGQQQAALAVAQAAEQVGRIKRLVGDQPATPPSPQADLPARPPQPLQDRAQRGKQAHGRAGGSRRHFLKEK